MYLYARSDFMALIKCEECQKLISSSAKSCPNCGAPTQYGKDKKEKITMVAIWLLVVFALIVTLLIIIDKQNDKIVGTWVNEREMEIVVPESLKDYPSQQFISTTKYSYHFNEDGTCARVYEYVGGFTKDTRNTSRPCKYKLGSDKITITWLNDNGDAEGEIETKSFSYGGTYIKIDGMKYEKEY